MAVAIESMKRRGGEVEEEVGRGCVRWCVEGGGEECLRLCLEAGFGWEQGIMVGAGFERVECLLDYLDEKLVVDVVGRVAGWFLDEGGKVEEEEGGFEVRLCESRSDELR